MSSIDLLQDVKNYLRNPPESDEVLLGFIERGKKYLNNVAGTELDFAYEDLPKSLLLDYCRYAESQALEVFSKNFESLLVELNEREALKNYENTNAD